MDRQMSILLVLHSQNALTMACPTGRVARIDPGTDRFYLVYPGRRTSTYCFTSILVAPLQSIRGGRDSPLSSFDTLQSSVTTPWYSYVLTDQIPECFPSSELLGLTQL